MRVGRVEQGEDQPAEILDMEDREAALGRQRDEAAARHLEQFERLAVAGAVDGGRAEDRPVEAGGGDDAAPTAPSTSHNRKGPARARRARRCGRSGARRRRARRRSSPAVPPTLTASKPARPAALIRPAMWTTASAPSQSAARLSGRSSAPSIQSMPVLGRAPAAGQRADLVAGRAGERAADGRRRSRCRR